MHAPIRATVSQPAPFSLPKHLTTTEKPTQYHYITKPYRGNEGVTNTTTVGYEETPLVRKVIVPTTYSPPKFFLKSLLYLTNTSSTEAPENVANKPHKTFKFVRKLVTPEVELDEAIAHNTNKEAGYSEHIQPNPYRHSTLVRNKPIVNKEIAIISSSSSTTTSTTTFIPTETTTVQTTQATVEKSSTYQIDEEYLHDRLKSRYTTEMSVQKPEKRFRNTVEVPPPDQLLYNPEDVPKAELDEPPSYKPKPILKVTTPPDVTTKTVADAPRNTTRTSRVNAAIKSQIAFGGARRPNTKCNDTTSNVNCNDSKLRYLFQS